MENPSGSTEIPTVGKSFNPSKMRGASTYGQTGKATGKIANEFWKQHGFCILPRTDRQGKAALDAKNYLCTVCGWEKYSELLASGRSVQDVAKILFQNEGDKVNHTFGTVYKYLQLYRRFFLTPMQLLESGEFSLQAGRRGSAGKGNGVSYKEVLAKKLGTLTRGLAEVQVMELGLAMQWERIQEQRKLEQTLQFPLPSLGKEIEEMRKTAVACVNLKMDLGFNGYLRVPKMVDVAHSKSDPRKLRGLTDEEKGGLKEFGSFMIDLIENSDGVHEDPAIAGPTNGASEPQGDQPFPEPSV